MDAYLQRQQVHIRIGVSEALAHDAEGVAGGHLAALDDVADVEVLGQVLLGPRDELAGGLR